MATFWTPVAPAEFVEVPAPKPK
jgi:hypothetical protein